MELCAGCGEGDYSAIVIPSYIPTVVTYYQSSFAKFTKFSAFMLSRFGNKLSAEIVNAPYKTPLDTNWQSLFPEVPT